MLRMLLLSLFLAIAPIGQPCEMDKDCLTGTPRGMGRCTETGRCVVPPVVYRTYVPATLGWQEVL